MPIIDTVLIGEPVLRKKTTAVTDFTDPKLQQVITDLVDTMRSAELIGIAAPQIGESLSIFVSEIRETAFRKGLSDALRIYINPKISSVSREIVTDWEGCGSIPGIFGQVTRAKEVRVEYFDVSGAKQTLKCTDLLARLVQHEIDHLQGILFTDIADPKTFVSGKYYVEHIRGK